MSTRSKIRFTLLGAVIIATAAVPAIADTTARVADQGEATYPLRFSALEQDNSVLFLNRYSTVTPATKQQAVSRGLYEDDVLLPEMQARPRVQARVQPVAPQQATSGRLSIRNNWTIGAFR